LALQGRMKDLELLVLESLPFRKFPCILILTVWISVNQLIFPGWSPSLDSFLVYEQVIPGWVPFLWWISHRWAGNSQMDSLSISGDPVGGSVVTSRTKNPPASNNYRFPYSEGSLPLEAYFENNFKRKMSIKWKINLILLHTLFLIIKIK
jgi:hypothetical protein